MSPETVRAALLAYFIAAGYPQPQILAIDRYVASESGYDYLVQANSGACLFQHAGVRRRRLMRGSGGCPPLQEQLRFADAELRSPPFSCFLRARGGAAYAVLRRTFGMGYGC